MRTREIEGALGRHAERLTEALIVERAYPRRSLAGDRAYVGAEFRHIVALRRRLAPRRALAAGSQEEVLCVLPLNWGFWALIPVLNLLLAGNRVRVKIPRDCPRSGAVLGAMLSEIAGPDWVTTDGRPGPDLLEHALRDERCRGVCVYGSERAGLAYDAVAERPGCVVLFEGPGNNPHIVLPDAASDVGARVVDEKFASFGGQGCTSPERVLVHESRYDEVVTGMAERMASLRVGDPSDHRVDVGPIRHEPLRRRLAEQLDDALAQGGHLVCGASPEGEWAPPTLVAGLTEGMRAMREEIFGPTLYAAPFDDPGEALALARSSPYGLGAAVWGEAGADELVAELEGAAYLEPVVERVVGRFGCVNRNGVWRGNSFDTPFGGYGLSGWVWRHDGAGDAPLLLQGPKHVAYEFSQP